MSDFVPNPSDHVGTYDTSGFGQGEHAHLENISAGVIFASPLIIAGEPEEPEPVELSGQTQIVASEEEVSVPDGQVLTSLSPAVEAAEVQESSYQEDDHPPLVAQFSPTEAAVPAKAKSVKEAPVEKTDSEE